MQKYFYSLILLTFISCSTESPQIDEFDTIPKSAEVVAQNNQFAFDLFREVAKNPEADNFMISPVSASLALSMVYNGAAGETATAFNEVLKYENATVDEVNLVNRSLIDHLTDTPKGSTFEIANSLWFEKTFPVNDNFLSVNKEYYKAQVENLDFSEPATVDIINDWVKDKTHNKIPTIIESIDRNTVLFAINALYFNSQWKHKFNKEDNRQMPFYLEDGTIEQVETMNMTENFAYFGNEIFSSVVLPYKNDKFNMVLLLPNEDISADDLIEGMDMKDFKTILDNNTVKNIQISIPKFKFPYKKLFNEPLINMGLAVAFSENANFSNLSDVATHISFVLQKTYIDVNEKGTEAAAVTVVRIETTSAGPPRFVLNRPFLFLITEKHTNAIAFMGKVGAPEYD